MERQSSPKPITKEKLLIVEGNDESRGVLPRNP